MFRFTYIYSLLTGKDADPDPANAKIITTQFDARSFDEVFDFIKEDYGFVDWIATWVASTTMRYRTSSQQFPLTLREESANGSWCIFKLEVVS